MSDLGLELGTFCSREQYLNRSVTAPQISHFSVTDRQLETKPSQWALDVVSTLKYGRDVVNHNTTFDSTFEDATLFRSTRFQRRIDVEDATLFGSTRFQRRIDVEDATLFRSTRFQRRIDVDAITLFRPIRFQRQIDVDATTLFQPTRFQRRFLTLFVSQQYLTDDL